MYNSGIPPWEYVIHFWPKCVQHLPQWPNRPCQPQRCFGYLYMAAAVKWIRRFPWPVQCDLENQRLIYAFFRGQVFRRLSLEFPI